MLESSDKTWSTGEGNGKPLQYFCLGNPMNSMKRQRATELNTLVSTKIGGFSPETGGGGAQWQTTADTILSKIWAISLSSKSLQMTNAGESVEQREPYTVVGNVNWYSRNGKEYGGSSEN